MTLIIGKIDRENRKQVMYSDGIMLQGPVVSSDVINKIGVEENSKTKFIIGCAGPVTWNRFVRMTLPSKIQQKKLHLEFEYPDMVEEHLTEKT